MVLISVLFPQSIQIKVAIINKWHIGIEIFRLICYNYFFDIVCPELSSKNVQNTFISEKCVCLEMFHDGCLKTLNFMLIIKILFFLLESAHKPS